ncbi:hypothetical protein [Micromonospora sp. LOL_021]|uniref:hypothetical protein n=1 Tax=Micromonospora sp. LOL_021 TaxID=3345417 RepID=UPI003A8952D7
MTTTGTGIGPTASESPVIAVLYPSTRRDLNVPAVSPVFADVLIDRTAGCPHCRATRLLTQHPGAAIALVVTAGSGRVVTVAVRDAADGPGRTYLLSPGGRPWRLTALARQLYGRWSLGAADLAGALDQPQSGEDLGGR